jgi:hypothetical protein
LPDPDDFLIAQVAVVITPGFSLDPATQRPFGHYVLMGSANTNFHAETLICTEWGIEAGWGSGACPPGKDGWPAPEPGPPPQPPQQVPAQPDKAIVELGARGEQEEEMTVGWFSTESRLRRPPVADAEALAALLLLD